VAKSDIAESRNDSRTLASQFSLDIKPEPAAALGVSVIVFEKYLVVGCDWFYRDNRYRPVWRREVGGANLDAMVPAATGVAQWKGRFA
jgi:hypothetical protein